MATPIALGRAGSASVAARAGTRDPVDLHEPGHRLQLNLPFACDIRLAGPDAGVEPSVAFEAWAPAATARTAAGAPRVVATKDKERERRRRRPAPFSAVLTHVDPTLLVEVVRLGETAEGRHMILTRISDRPGRLAALCRWSPNWVQTSSTSSTCTKA